MNRGDRLVSQAAGAIAAGQRLRSAASANSRLDPGASRSPCISAKRVRPVTSASQGAYSGLMADVLHPTYLPFTAEQLQEHFAPVLGPGERDRHLRYYLASVEEARKYDELTRRGGKPTPAQTKLGRQMEKDERFWLTTALMSLYHADRGSGRAELFGRLLERAGLRPPPGFPRWEDALAGALDLFFEVTLPSPGRYRSWLRDHLGERAPIPYLKDRAEARGRGWKERRGPTPCCSLPTPQ